MVEVFSIFIQLLVFFILFLFPFNPENLTKLLKTNHINFSWIDAHALNIIFFFYFCLIISFLNLDLKIIFIFYFVTTIIFNLIFLKNLRINLDKEKIIYFLIFMIVNISIFFFMAQNLKLEWDGLHWMEKVLIFFNNEKIENFKNVSVHAEYPHLGAYVWAFFWKNSLLKLEYFGRFFYPYFYVSCLFSVLNFAKIKNFYFKIFILLSLILITFEPYLFAGYQEYLIFSSLILASYYICLSNFSNIRILILVILIFNISIWFKDEGLIYYCLFGSMTILFYRINNKKKFLVFLFGASLPILQFLSQKFLIGIYDFPQTNNISNLLNDVTNASILISKISLIIIHIIITFIKYPMWLIILFCFVINFFTKRLKAKNLNFFMINLLIIMFIISAIFFSFAGFEFMLKVSLDRILFQVSGFFLILLVLNLKELSK